MGQDAVITTRIDGDTKKQAVDIFHKLGISTTQAISMFLRQVIYVRGIPFDVKVPNEETLATFEDTDAGKDLHRVSGIDKLAEELKT